MGAERFKTKRTCLRKRFPVDTCKDTLIKITNFTETEKAFVTAHILSNYTLNDKYLTKVAKVELSCCIILYWMYLLY